MKVSQWFAKIHSVRAPRNLTKYVVRAQIEQSSLAECVLRGEKLCLAQVETETHERQSMLHLGQKVNCRSP